MLQKRISVLRREEYRLGEKTPKDLVVEMNEKLCKDYNIPICGYCKSGFKCALDYWVDRLSNDMWLREVLKWKERNVVMSLYQTKAIEIGIEENIGWARRLGKMLLLQ